MWSQRSGEGPSTRIDGSTEKKQEITKLSSSVFSLLASEQRLKGFDLNIRRYLAHIFDSEGFDFRFRHISSSIGLYTDSETELLMLGSYSEYSWKSLWSMRSDDTSMMLT